MSAQAFDDVVSLLPGLSAVEKLRLVEVLAGDVERELQQSDSAGRPSAAQAEAWQRFMVAGRAISHGWTSDLTAAELLSSMRR